MSYTNPIVTGGGPSSQSIFEVTTSPREKVGTRGALPDGRVFYYASSKDAAAIPKGQLAMAEVIPAAQANDNPSAAAAVGAESVSITLSSSQTHAADDFAQGYLIVNDAAGEGETYSVKGSTAVAAGTAITVTLNDPIRVALTTSSEVTLMKNPWQHIDLAAAGHVHMAAGVPAVDIPIGSTDTQYAWVQTWGVCAGWDDAATAIGAVLQSGTTAGQFEVGDGAAQPVGVQLYTGVASEYYPKFLTIAP